MAKLRRRVSKMVDEPVLASGEAVVYRLRIPSSRGKALWVEFANERSNRKIDRGMERGPLPLSLNTRARQCERSQVWNGLVATRTLPRHFSRTEGVHA